MFLLILLTTFGLRIFLNLLFNTVVITSKEVEEYFKVCNEVSALEIDGSILKKERTYIPKVIKISDGRLSCFKYKIWIIKTITITNSK